MMHLLLSIYGAGTQYYMGRRLSFLLPARQINADWPGLPDNIDTAVYLDGSIVFFKVGMVVFRGGLINLSLR